MIAVTIYAIGMVGDLRETLGQLVNQDPPDFAMISKINDELNTHQEAQRECKPPMDSYDLVEVMRAGGITVDCDELFDNRAVIADRAQASVQNTFADLSARMVYLIDHPESSLIFIEHEGYRLADPVDDMLFKVGR